MNPYFIFKIEFKNCQNLDFYLFIFELKIIQIGF